MWSKLIGVKYSTLQTIAKDMLAIPISNTTLDALMSARSWYWSEENKGKVVSLQVLSIHIIICYAFIITNSLNFMWFI